MIAYTMFLCSPAFALVEVIYFAVWGIIGLGVFAFPIGICMVLNPALSEKLRNSKLPFFLIGYIAAVSYLFGMMLLPIGLLWTIAYYLFGIEISTEYGMIFGFLVGAALIVFIEYKITIPRRKEYLDRVRPN